MAEQDLDRRIRQMALAVQPPPGLDRWRTAPRQAPVLEGGRWMPRFRFDTVVGIGLSALVVVAVAIVLAVTSQPKAPTPAQRVPQSSAQPSGSVHPSPGAPSGIASPHGGTSGPSSLPQTAAPTGTPFPGLIATPATPTPSLATPTFPLAP